MMTLPAPTKAPIETPCAPAPPTPPPPLDPATAFATPRHVMAWLLRLQEEGKRSVGCSGDDERCPLAHFARTELGLRYPQVNHLGWTDVPIPEGSSNLRLRYTTEKRTRGHRTWGQQWLPPWCDHFVLRVDDQPVRTISPKRALRILGEVMTNEDIGTCPT